MFGEHGLGENTKYSHQNPGLVNQVSASVAGWTASKVKAPIKNHSKIDWPWGSPGAERYGCILQSAAHNLGEIPSKKKEALNSLF